MSERKFSKNESKQQHQGQDLIENLRRNIGIRQNDQTSRIPTNIQSQISQQIPPPSPLPPPPPPPPLPPRILSSKKIVMSPVEYLEYVAAREEFAPHALSATTSISNIATTTTSTIPSTPSTDHINLSSINIYPHKLKQKQQEEDEEGGFSTSSKTKFLTFPSLHVAGNIDNNTQQQQQQYYKQQQHYNSIASSSKTNNTYPTEISPSLQENFSRFSYSDDYMLPTKRNSLPLSPLDEVKNQIADLQLNSSPTPPLPQRVISQERITQGVIPHERISQGAIPQEILISQKQKQKMPIYQYNDLTPPDVLTQLQPPSSPRSSNKNNSIIISRVNTPSTSTLSGLTKNISRHSSPKFESVPRIITGFTAQVQSSNSPLKQEFRNSIRNSNNDDDDDDDDADHDYFFLNPDRYNSNNSNNSNYNFDSQISQKTYQRHGFHKNDISSIERDSIDSINLLAGVGNPIMQTELRLDSSWRKGEDRDDSLLNINNNEDEDDVKIDIDYSPITSRGIQIPQNVYIPKNQRKKYIKNNITGEGGGEISEFREFPEENGDHDNDITQQPPEKNEEKYLKKKPKQGTFFLFIGILAISLMIIILFIISKRIPSLGTFKWLSGEEVTITHVHSPTSTTSIASITPTTSIASIITPTTSVAAT
ncbi:hypothetical protein Glove_99g43 [Diversispora epigaea]|uniref:Uncharacterized protein n=1 Tax=Diversispora epigaea TaxID=1348612 RepID=A0A397J488_9GLOM|nr:hypothetical protein Glove_99g43 [Diversispora epigaea]